MASNLPHFKPSSEVTAGQSISRSVTSIFIIGVISYLVQPVLITLCVSILFAFLLAPATDALHKLKLPRAIAAGIAVTLVVLVFYFIVSLSYDRGMIFLRDLPKHASKYREMILRVRQQAETIQKTSESVLPKTTEEKAAIRVIPQTDWLEILSRNLGSVTELIFLLSFVPFLVFFMLTWQDHLQRSTVLLFRADNRRRIQRTLHLVSVMIRSFLLGSLLVGLLVGAASTLAFALLGLPYYYFTGMLSGILSLVPYLGVILAPVPPLLYGADVMSAKEIVLVLSIVTALHVIAINVLYPKLLGHRLRLNPLVLTIALLFWGWLWGGIGLVLAIPITAGMKIIFDHVPSLRAYGRLMGTDSVRKIRGTKTISVAAKHSPNADTDEVRIPN